MTTTDTMDTEATVAQCIRMIEAGCELVRITAPSQNEARNLAEIRKALRKKGYDTPLIADIHFTPKAAEIAAEIVEKVRINPGNYADRKKFENPTYSDAEYDEELDRIRERFAPLVERCKTNGVAMRIGTNHGSLSDRIMGRYGDTPLGMVESALEFVRICRDLNYHDIILSMKASNPLVMVEANRLLVERMDAEGMDYPLHLGVTEAGEGEDGRIKSAVGIGTLLMEGIGDTIRVSLTEEPEAELPVARSLVELATRPFSKSNVEQSTFQIANTITEPNSTVAVNSIGGENPPRVIASLDKTDPLQPTALAAIGYRYIATLDKWSISDQAADMVYVGSHKPEFPLPTGLTLLFYKESSMDGVTLYSLSELSQVEENRPVACLVQEEEVLNGIPTEICDLKNLIWIFDYPTSDPLTAWRRMFEALRSQGNRQPVILRYTSQQPEDRWLLEAAVHIGGLFLDGLGDGVWLDVFEPSRSVGVAFGILQAVRARISKTEYISCPSCGRTLFDLQETTARIRSRTSHLKGVKIGIMGCIVNGPGEMADADYGYVGTGPGKIALYKGQEVIHRNISADQAVDQLIDLIQTHGDWVDPPNPVEES